MPEPYLIGAQADEPAYAVELSTIRGQKISNRRDTAIPAYERSFFSDYQIQFPLVQRRGGPTATFNCHGLTFATRRAAIIESECVNQIISDDNYLEIPEDNVLPGDVVIYFSDTGDLEHSGVVMQVEPPSLNILKRMMVLSKWGSYAELLHDRYQCPYTKNLKFYRLKCPHEYASS